MDDTRDVTDILREASRGNRDALDRLMPLVYRELRGLATRQLSAERSDHTLQTTALVHEAYLRLVDQSRVEWQNRAHFFAVASQAIRRILIDHARAHGRVRRGSGVPRLSLDDALGVPGLEVEEDILALDAALLRFTEIDPLRARIVELRFFGGLTHEEIAQVLAMSVSTVERHWRFARAWLFRELARVGDP